MRNLVIGDPHEPVSHPGYMAFCYDMACKYQCDGFICIGDIADHHAISFHAANPMCPGPNDEAELTYEAIQKWYKIFPNMKACIGNHDARVIRLAETVKIPERFLKHFNDAWGTPTWEWDYEFHIEDVCYMHGTGRGGVHPAWNAISKKMKSVVMGHCHSRAGVKWRCNGDARFFGMDTGCGIDVRAWQFAYGKNFDERPFLACGVVLDGEQAISIPMPCGPGERYYRGNF